MKSGDISRLVACFSGERVKKKKNDHVGCLVKEIYKIIAILSFKKFNSIKKHIMGDN